MFKIGRRGIGYDDAVLIPEINLIKIAIVTDSNSGITQDDAAQLGVFVLPMPFMINEETFYEDIDLSQEQFYEKLMQGDQVVTSQPSPEAVMKLDRKSVV